MIQTNSVQFTTKTFFATLLAVYFKKRWWLLIWFLVVSIALLFKEQKDSFEKFVAFIGLVYPIIIVFQYWRFANSKDNKVFFLERNYEITEDKIIGNLSDGTSNEILIVHLTKAIKLKRCFLLYLSKNQFLYFPKDSFKSESDKNWFEQKIVSQIKS